MSAGDWAEFFFFGSFALPATLLLVGLPAIGALAFIVLMIAGCLSGACDPHAPFREGPGEPPES